MVTKVPDEIKNACDDYVSYDYIDLKTGETVTKENRPCFSSVFSNSLKVPKNTELRLFSNNTHNVRLDEDRYMEWMRLCQENGLVVSNAEIYTEKDDKGVNINVLKFKRTDCDESVFYSTLCCYRFSDSFLRMIWLIVENMLKSNGEFTFWQAFHYGLVKECACSIGHSFTRLNKYSSLYNEGGGPYNNNKRNDLLHTLAVKHFFKDMSREEREKMVGGCVYEKIDRIMSKIGHSQHIPNKTNFTIKNMEELLTDKWTPMYFVEDPSYNKYLKLYEKIKNG